MKISQFNNTPFILQYDIQSYKHDRCILISQINQITDRIRIKERYVLINRSNILTDTGRILHLESLLTRALERPNGVHAQLIAPVLRASALVDISAPRGIVLIEAEAFFATARNRPILRGANLLAAAVVIGTRIYRVARFVP